MSKSQLGWLNLPHSAILPTPLTGQLTAWKTYIMMDWHGELLWLTTHKDCEIGKWQQNGSRPLASVAHISYKSRSNTCVNEMPGCFCFICVKMYTHFVWLHTMRLCTVLEWCFDTVLDLLQSVDYVFIVDHRNISNRTHIQPFLRDFRNVLQYLWDHNNVLQVVFFMLNIWYCFMNR